MSFFSSMLVTMKMFLVLRVVFQQICIHLMLWSIIALAGTKIASESVDCSRLWLPEIKTKWL
ncbi:MAG: hypothetical protein CME30_03400 [Gemmatimonadetes bacterium]|nr:hypothetical protein [Gemmatimonadota bacterium]